MRRLLVLSLTLCTIAVVSNIPGFAGWDPAKEKEEWKAAEKTIRDFKTKDPSIKRFFDNAHGYAVFPTVGTGAFIIGGAHGTGLAVFSYL